MSFANKVTRGTYKFVSLIVKIILLALSALSISLSLPDAGKTQYFVFSSFQLIHGIYFNIQKLVKYFNGTPIVAFVRIPSEALSAWGPVFSNHLTLYSKDLKLVSLTISALKLVASSLNYNLKLPFVSE